MTETIVDIFCMNCERTREHEWGAGNYHCTACGDTVTEDAYNLVLATMKDYEAQYKGAKIAGLIPDPEWKEFDKENNPNG